MRVLPPLEMTEARLTSSTAAEPGVGEVAWTSGATFAQGDKAILGAPSATVTLTIASPCVVTWTDNGLPDGTPVVLTTSGALPTGLTAGVIYFVIDRTANTFRLSATMGGAPIVTTGSQSGTHTATAQIHRTYFSVVGSNMGNPPAIDDGTNWLDIGPTNKWAMFDLLRNTATTVASPLTVVITPGRRIDSIGLVGLVADQAEITLTVDGVEVYSVTRNLSTRQVTTWREHFFEPFSTAPSLALFDLPPFTDGVLTVTLTRASGMVSCGGLLVGTSVYIGQMLYDAVSDALNFSRIERNFAGEASLTPRRSVPKVTGQVRFDKGITNKIRELRKALNAVPALWSGLEDVDSPYFEAVLILGIYKQFSINLDFPEHGLLSLELEEI